MVWRLVERCTGEARGLLHNVCKTNCGVTAISICWSRQDGDRQSTDTVRLCYTKLPHVSLIGQPDLRYTSQSKSKRLLSDLVQTSSPLFPVLDTDSHTCARHTEGMIIRPSPLPLPCSQSIMHATLCFQLPVPKRPCLLPQMPHAPMVGTLTDFFL